jgi:threonine dehydrogenase-like Zn-dependent dehydrogenase
MARAFWTVAAGRGEIREHELRAPDDGEVRVRTRFSAVSRGSEALVFAGRVPDTEFQRMRAPFQRGEFPFPVCYGYACVGDVDAGDPALAGKTVFCLHPHQDHFVVPSDAVVPLPGDVPPERAVLAANLETALNATWDGAPGPCDRVAIVGGGVVGLLVGALVADLPGVEATLIDVAEARRGPAETLGLTFRAPARAPAGCDVVFHASGSASGLATALACAGDEATVVELSWFGRDDVPVPLGDAFHPGRLTLKSSQVGRVSPSRAPRWSTRRRLSAALALLADARFDALLTGESAFADLPDVMPELAAGGGDVLCHRIRY